MVIESEARKRVVTAIELEKDVHAFEIREKLKGKVVLNCETYNELRKKLVAACGKINSVANTEGKGRDDLTVDILIAAEGITRRISNSQSRAVRKLADRIKASFNELRQVFRKYSENIELVDPQLKNNQDLVELLIRFEKSWEKGKEFFLNPKLCNMLIHFSRLIEGVCEKYPHLQEKIEAVDTDVFVIVPCLAVLSSLDGDDKGICHAYYPALSDGAAEESHYLGTKDTYLALKRRGPNGYELYNIVELTILERQATEEQLRKSKVSLKEINQLVHEIKRIAMGLQRHQPTEWNYLMEAAMGQA
jgi:hypothetical protein